MSYCTAQINDSFMTAKSTQKAVRILGFFFLFDVHVFYAWRCWIYPLYSKYWDGVCGWRFTFYFSDFSPSSKIVPGFVLRVASFAVACFFLASSLCDATTPLSFLSMYEMIYLCLIIIVPGQAIHGLID